METNGTGYTGAGGEEVQTVNSACLKKVDGPKTSLGKDQKT